MDLWTQWGKGRVGWLEKVPLTYTHGMRAYESLQGVGLCVSLWAVTCQAAQSMGFSRQESWTGFPCPPPEVLPDPGIKLPCGKQIARRKLLQSARTSAWCSVMTHRGRMGVRWRLKKEDTYVTYGFIGIYSYNWFSMLYGRSQHNIIKQLSSN